MMSRHIAFVGDICLAGRPSTGQFLPIAPLAHAIRQTVGENVCLVGTVEAPISNRGAPKPHKACLRANPNAARLIEGFDVGLLGNNHIADFGSEAAIDTCAALIGMGCQPVGYGSNLSEALAPAMVDLGGVKVAILSFCCLTTRADGFATDRLAGVAPLSLQLLRNSIHAARENADIVIVCPHWGVQGASLPTLDDILLARASIESGAAAVIGTHAHVAQASETYLGAPIVYGLGNYLFDSVDAAYVDHTGRPTGVHYRVSQTDTNRTSLLVALKPVRQPTGWKLELAGRWLAQQGDDLSITHKPLAGPTAADRELRRRLAFLPLDFTVRKEPSYLCSVRDGILTYSPRLSSLDRVSWPRAVLVRAGGITRSFLRWLRGR